eukprot:SAG11_NODE_13697_length_643_cov_0.915441_2_plen_93_part_00
MHACVCIVRALCVYVCGCVKGGPMKNLGCAAGVGEGVYELPVVVLVEGSLRPGLHPLVDFLPRALASRLEALTLHLPSNVSGTIRRTGCRRY